MPFSLGGRVPEVAEDVWIAPTASVIGSVQLRPGASVWFGCVLRGDVDDILIGEGTNVQDGAVLHTDVGIKLTVGRDCTIGHQVMLHGCTIGDNSLIGIQSVILNRAVIGRNSLVGAGSLVPEGKVFPDGVLLMGRPAKVVRELSPAEQQIITLSAQHYVRNAARFKAELTPA
ncbi:gamma carbonic anhydrase family protein [Flagellatimonas centrodinii]|uniref:gamma carbonic anhydrase family protein n=1 Tax=Flagellatimonas centrodinii TaxID=2806210 RepID=UPI001FF01837|nr:gamma carbonic anhydrase family protein [Flagellatimonas centrodinii]ULQ45813.1 gamma carbonic anhydrase family protein [Flagellatimonas centrodinii]